MILPIYYKENFGYGVIGTALNNSDTTAIFESGHNFPLDTAVYFKIIVWRKSTYPNPADDSTAEIMTAVYSGTINQYTVIRGEEGTSGVAHSAGEGAAMTMTAEIFCQRTNRSLIYSTIGTFSYTMPAGVREVRVKMWGAGGGPGFRTLFHPTSNQYTWFGGGGGGAGAYCEGVIPLASSTLTIIVGQGGGSQTDGGNCSVSDGTTTVVAGGGKKGFDGQGLSFPGPGGPGGTYSGTTSGIVGGNGSAGVLTSGSAGEDSSYGDGGYIFCGIKNGGYPGGGGKGSSTTVTSGANGLIIIEY